MLYPERYPDIQEVKRKLPQPEYIEIRPGLRLETLHAPGPRPALVFIHGGLGNLWNHYAQLDHFHQKRELIAYSLAGNGNSDQHKDRSLQAHIQDLRDLLQVLAVEGPILDGWSYGVALALEYAKQYPTSALMLTGGAAYGMTPGWERPMMKLGLVLRLYQVLPGAAFMKRLARWAALHPESPDRLLDEVLEFNPFPRRRSAWLTVVDSFWGYDGRDTLGSIRCPALVVHGPADRIVPIERAERTAHLLPKGAFVRLEKTGHGAPVERYDTFNWLLERLIQGAIAPRDWPSISHEIARAQ